MTLFALSSFLVPLGLACLPPFRRLWRDDSPGLAFLCGWAAIVGVLFLAGVAGAPLHVVAGILAVAAAAGLADGAWRRCRSIRALLHPLFALTILVVCLLIAAGPVVYQVYAWDAWTNWVGWSRQIVVADAYFRSDMWVAIAGYPPGWPLAMAFPGLLSGVFVVEDAWSVVISLHVGLLALFYDLARRIFLRFARMDGATASMSAWIVVLAGLALELSWSLVPVLLLIEEPQYFFLAAGFLALGLGFVRGTATPRLLAAATLMMLTAYLFKTSFVTYAPGYVLMAGCLIFAADGRVSFHRAGVLQLSAIVLSIAALMGLWSQIAADGRCHADTAGMIARLASGEAVHGIPLDRFAAALAGRMTDFALSWKLPLTLAALAGFAAFGRLPFGIAAILALATLWLAFYVGVLGGMATCFSEHEISIFASVQRYTRVPLRLTQTTGLFMALAVAAIFVGVLRDRSRLPSIGRTTVILAALIAALASWQVHRGYRSILDVEVRANLAEDDRRRIRIARNDTETVFARFAGIAPEPHVLFYFSSAPHTEPVAAQFAGLGTRRGDPMRRIEVLSASLTAAPAELDALRRTLAGVRAVAIAGAAGPALQTLPEIADGLSRCTAADRSRDSAPDGYLLLRRPEDGRFDCRKRTVGPATGAPRDVSG